MFASNRNLFLFLNSLFQTLFYFCSANKLLYNSFLYHSADLLGVISNSRRMYRNWSIGNVSNDSKFRCL